MNLQQLRYIVEIADCHSITKASKKLFVSQPYLSKVVSDFEARVNNQIFIRYNNGLELTFGLLWLCQSILILLIKELVLTRWKTKECIN